MRDNNLYNKQVAHIIYNKIGRIAKSKRIYSHDLHHDFFEVIYQSFLNNFNQSRGSLNTFIINQFNYCLKTWNSDNNPSSSYKERQKKAFYKKESKKIQKAKERIKEKGETATLEKVSEETGFSINRTKKIENLPVIQGFEDIGIERDKINDHDSEPDVYYSPSLRNKIASLPYNLEDILQKYYFEGKSLNEIANDLNLSHNQVVGRKQKALKYLREKFGVSNN